MIISWPQRDLKCIQDIVLLISICFLLFKKVTAKISGYIYRTVKILTFKNMYYIWLIKAKLTNCS